MRRVSSWRTVAMLLLAARTVYAQSGSGYDLLRKAIDGGGGISATGIYSVDATIGQPDAGTATGGSYILLGGFWGGIGGGEVPSPTPTPSTFASRSVTPSPSQIGTPTRTPTVPLAVTRTPTTASTPNPSATLTLTGSPSASFTPTGTATRSVTVVTSATPTLTTILAPTSTPTATVSPGYPVGDGNCDGVVSAADVADLLARIAAPQSPLCGADANGDRVVDASDLPVLIERLFGE